MVEGRHELGHGRPPVDARSPTRRSTWGVVGGAWLAAAACLIAGDASAESDGDLRARAPALVADLLERARVHALDRVWIDAHVVAPSDSAAARWRAALAPLGPLERTLAATVSAGAPELDPRGVRVALDATPPIDAIIVDRDGEARLLTLEASSCSHCDPRHRWVEGVIADVRRHGTLRDRLQPDLELLRSPETPLSRWETWAPLQEVHLRVDQDVARRIASARVLGTDADVVYLRYADGAEDRWRIVPSPRGWGVSYDDLPATSPLVLGPVEARRWRRVGPRQEAAVATWGPSWQPRYGAAVSVGHDVLAGAFQPGDDTVQLVVVDAVAPWAGVFRVDPAHQEVLERLAVPLPDYGRGARLVAGPGLARAAVGDDDAIVAAMGGVWRARAGEIVALGRADTPDAIALGADAPAILRTEGSPRVLAGWREGDAEETVTADGVVHVLHDGVATTWPTCGGRATAAARRASDGVWLVACDRGARATFALVSRPVVSHWGPDGGGGAVAAWSTTGRWLVFDAPEGLVVWDLLVQKPSLLLPVRDVVAASFRADDGALLTVDRRGEAMVWDLLQAAPARRPRTWEPK